MSGPFKVGDVVCCVDLSPIVQGFGVSSRIKLGSVYRVSATFTDGFGACVRLSCVTADTVNGGFLARRFRHLPKADDQFIQQMRAIKPVREGVSA